MSTTSSFYVTGGTLRQGAPSYVERQADRDLYEGLLRGEYCYVLHARQMGKSSLMVHTTARLRQEGVAVAAFELTALGQNLSVEQWYDGLLARIGRNLDLEEALEEYWLAHERLAPLQRWLGALEQVVLARCPERIVIFIDEIDAVRSLPFRTDEFFAAIRECYNRRSQEPEFARLTFCLLGVATPSDLIQDTRTTPFNIGRRIELSDFGEVEARPLATGLGREPQTGQALLQRVLYWTGGHPYLTQRLCQAVAEDDTVTDAAGVDRQCEALFLSAQARERDDNLLFVRERLLRSEADLASLLDLYAQVWAGKRVAADDTNSLIDLLRLSGIARSADGRLQVRNRIYARVFDRHWVVQHMPDAELRRQRTAYRRGLVRAAAGSAGIVAVVVVLALAALTQSHRANHHRRIAEQQQRRAEERERTARRYLYAAQMKLAQQTWAEGNLGRALDLLEAWRPHPGGEDLRGFEWRYLWRLCQQGDARRTFHVCREGIASVVFSDDGKTLAAACNDGTVRLWNASTEQPLCILRGHRAGVYAVAFSPDGRMLASSSADHTLRLWDVSSHRLVATLRDHKTDSYTLVFSPDGKTLFTVSSDVGLSIGQVTMWDLASRRIADRLRPGHRQNALNNIALSPDGRLLATTGDNDVKLWDVASKRVLATLIGHQDQVDALAFSPDGRRLVSGGVDKTVKLWDVATKRLVGTLRGSLEWVLSVAFSPDGKRVAAGSSDGAVRLWDVASGRGVATFKGHQNRVYAVAFSPDGRRLASSSEDGTVRLWQVAREADPSLLQPLSITTIAFSPDATVMATGSNDGSVALWDVASRRRLARLKGQKGAIRQLVFAPDGRRLATGSEDQTVRLWDLGSGQPLATFPRFKAALTDWLGYPSSVAFSPDGRSLAMSSTEDTVQLWAGGPEWRPRTAGGTIRLAAAFPAQGSVAFSPDGRMLAVKAGGDELTLWSTTLHRRLAPLKGAAGWSNVLQFSPDGGALATGGYGSIRLWNPTTGRLATLFKGPTNTTQLAWFSPDGKMLVVGRANSIGLWNIVSGQEMAVLRGHTAPVLAAAFSGDGNTLITASRDGVVRRWQAASHAESEPLQGLASSGSDRAVMIQWRPSPSAIGYHVYRGPVGASAKQLVRQTSRPIAGPPFIDRGLDLVNGVPRSYAVAAVFREGGRQVEGSRVMLQGTPVAPPPGFTGYSIDEGALSGSVAFDAASGQITLRGAGADIFGEADQFYFLCRPVTGDFQLTVRLLSRVTDTNIWAKAGPMLRESLDVGARNAHLCLTASRGIQYNWRPIPNDSTATQTLAHTSTLKQPLLLRLTRRGDTVTAEDSRDDGRSFQTAGEPYPFEPPLPKTLYVGLAITSHDPTQVSEAKFSDLRIDPK